MHNDGVYDTKLPVQALINDLNALAELDKESEKKISFWRKVRTVFFVLGGLSFLGFPILCIPGVGLIIAGCVIHFGTLKKIGNDEFPDYRYQICHKIVTIYIERRDRYLSNKRVISSIEQNKFINYIII